MDGVTAVNRCWQMVGTPTDIFIQNIIKSVSDTVTVVITITGYFLKTDNIRLKFLYVSCSFIHYVHLIPTKMTGIVSDYSQRRSFRINNF